MNNIRNNAIENKKENPIAFVKNTLTVASEEITPAFKSRLTTGNDLHDSRRKFAWEITKLIYSSRKRQINVVINNFDKVSAFFKEPYANLAVGYDGKARLDIVKVKALGPCLR